MSGNLEQLFGGPLYPPIPVPIDTQIRDAMREQDIEPPDEIILDGQIHRFQIETSKDAGWYIFYPDNISAGAFGDWRSGSSYTWVANIGRTLTEPEKMNISLRTNEAKEARKRVREQKAEFTADVVSDIWSKAPQADPTHPYLVKKGVSPHGIRLTGDGRLIVPMYVSGKLSSLQYIDSAGGKKYHSGGVVGGAIYVIGQSENPQKIYITEGFATGATVYEETETTTVVAFSANQLPKATGIIRKHYPTTNIVIVADKDQSGQGENHAYQAAAEHGADVLVPPDYGDVNDMRNRGEDVQSFLNPKKQEWLVPISEFIKQPQPIRWLIKGWVQADALMMVHGAPASGKTFLVLDWCMHIAYDRSWMDVKTRPGPIAYLAGEGHKGLMKRFAGWVAYHAVDPGNRVWMSRSGTDLDTPQGKIETMQHLRNMPEPPSLIVIDTLHRFLAGDENKAQDTRAMLQSCSEIMAEFNCSVLLVHHTGVSQEAQHRARGSSAWKGALDIEVSVTKKNDIVQIKCTKSKDEKEPAPIWVELSEIDVPGWEDEDGNTETTAIVKRTERSEQEEKKKDKTHEGSLSFALAWEATGKELYENAPYVTIAAWRKLLVEKDGLTPESAKTTIKPSSNRAPTYIKTMIENELLEREADGYIALNALAISLK